MNTPDDLIELGKIGEPYGLGGWVNVFASSDDPHVLLNTRSWWVSSLLDPAVARVRGQVHAEHLRFEPFKVLGVKNHAGHLVAHLEGIEQREVAATFKGRRIYVSRARFPQAGEDEVYWADLIGCTVENLQDQALGVVIDVVDHGAHPILVVKDEAKPELEHLIPFVKACVPDVYIDQKLVRVDWQEDF